MGPVQRSRLVHRAAGAMAPLGLLLIPSLFRVTLFSAWMVGAELDRDELGLVWSDDFNGGAVDWDKWVADEGDGCDVELCDWGNGEKQYYRSENAGVADGTLAITAKKEDYSSRFYTSSKITTKNKFSFRYGRAEARIRLPPGGQGLWPAFWMMPQDNAYGEWAASGEIDIFESRNNFTEVVNNLNYGNAFPNNTNNNGDCFLDVSSESLEEYHLYAVEWEAEEMVWFMDEDETCRLDSWFSTDVKTGEPRPMPAPFDQDFYLVLNMAVGGNDEFVGSDAIDDSVLPATMEVDFVRVYQSPEMTEPEEGQADGSRSVYVRDATGGGSRQGVEIWGEEFNGTEPSGDWEIATGEVCLAADVLCSSELQEFNAEAVVVEGGVLEVTVDVGTGSAAVDGTGGVTAASSGLLHTMDGFNFTYGRLEANISAPTAAGVVSTVSLLTMDDSAAVFGQVEVIAVEDGVATGGFWYPGGEFNFSCNTSYSSLEDADGASSFHVFAVEWTYDRFRWYADGVQYGEVTSTDVETAGASWSFDAEMYISVGATVGRDLGGSEVLVNASSLPATLSVDAIRAHQFNDMEASLAEAASAVAMYIREGNLTWQDEFDGIELDAASQEEAGEGILGLEYWWQHEEGDGCEMGICGFGNGEAQWYRKENTGVKDGKLIVTAKAEQYAGNIYTSAKLSTKANVVVTYGRIETRIKLPQAQGLWPSVWMLPEDSPYGGWASGGAINILEARNEMSRAHGQLWFGGTFPDVENLDLSEGGHCYSDMHEDLSDDYHVYALEWEPDSFRWYIDGVLYCERQYWYSRLGPGEDDYPFPAPFDTGFYLIMNVAVGGSFTGGLIDDDALAENPEMLVDYVRVYQLEGQSLFVADPPEDAGSRGGSALSAVTAVSVLVVLGVLFSLCLVANCVIKWRNKRTEESSAEAVAGGIGGRDESLDGSKGKKVTPPTKSNTTKGGGGGGGSSSSSSSRLKFLGGVVGRGASDKRVGGKAVADVARGADIPPVNSGSFEEPSPSSSRGLVGTGLPKVVYHSGGLGIGGSVGALGIADPQRRSARRLGGTATSGVQGPLGDRRAGPNEDRADITPGRFRLSGTRESGSSSGVDTDGDSEGGHAEQRVKHPRPASGTIPESYLAEPGAVAAAGVDGRGTAGTSGEESEASAAESSGAEASPVRLSSVEVAVDEAAAFSLAKRGSDAIASLDLGDDSDGSRGDESVWMGGGSAAGSLVGVGERRALGYAAEGSGIVRSGSYASEESVMPPTMAGLRLDSRPIEEAKAEQTGLPSYEQAVGVAYV